jgi:hypothetical protein
MPSINDITDILEIICEPNTMKEGHIYLKEYDLKYDKGGAIYNSKETIYFYEVLCQILKKPFPAIYCALSSSFILMYL